MNNKRNGTKFASLFGPEEILARTELTDRNELLMALLRLMAERRRVGDIEAAFQAIVAREEQASTIMAPGIAMPHARLDEVNELLVSVATSERGIRFSEGEGGVANLVILILVPKTAPGMYLQAVSALAGILKDPASVSRSVALECAEEVWRFFDRGGLALPDYVCAGDIMTRNTVAVQDSDTLEHAVDMLVKNNITELPVVDKDGDLVGMVSEDELLRVCLPDHILWMDDLSPIVNFEPFAEVLRNEHKTWLAEIMSLDYATVQENAPAIEVARELRRRTTREVFVLRGKKLVGVISLQDFINKVLRE